MALLSGWKEIAEHLHVIVGTAQRWEPLGPPVHRVSAGRRSPVIAIRGEVDAWVQKKATRRGSYVLAANSSLASQFETLQSMRRRAYRRTRNLLRSMENLGLEQRRIILAIQAKVLQKEASW